MILTKQQRQALHAVWLRTQEPHNTALLRNRTYKQFRKTVCPNFDYIMVPFAGMWLGIEKDGYTHS